MLPVVIRADASPSIGAGHVVRCSALASALAVRGLRCVLAGRPGSAEVLASFGEELETIELGGAPESEPEELARAFPEGAAWLVVDHYGRDAVFERTCRPWARRVLAIEDLPGRAHDCDLLLDPAVDREPATYPGLVAITGAAHALLRPQFADRRAEALTRQAAAESVDRVLVSIGGADGRGATALALRGIAAWRPHVGVDVVIGSGWPEAAELRALAAELLPGARVHSDVRDMAALMATADVGLGAAGSSAIERCCLGLPSALFVFADNQRDIARALEARGAALCLGEPSSLHPDRVAAALVDLAAERRAMSLAAGRVCDGEGAVRVAERMLSFARRP